MTPWHCYKGAFSRGGKAGKDYEYYGITESRAGEDAIQALRRRRAWQLNPPCGFEAPECLHGISSETYGP